MMDDFCGVFCLHNICEMKREALLPWWLRVVGHQSWVWRNIVKDGQDQGPCG